MQKMTKPRFELGTHTVLRCCHNQLDHLALLIFFLLNLFKKIINISLRYKYYKKYIVLYLF